jgi:beta-glucosidase
VKYQSLIEQMTLEEKASLMSGENFWNTKAIERLNIPSIMLTDGPHGLRKQGGKADHLGLNASLPATCYPTAATLANSWDRELLNEIGQFLAAECVSENVSVILGPGLNLKRNPLCGRNFEYFSEDPYLTGELASQQVKGIQSQGVAASPKHFAVNSQEHMRMTIDEVVDERSLRELYLEGFRRVVKQSKPKTIMSSYNKINGIYANEHPHLMNDILYGEWQFDGVMVTDWGGNNDRVAGLRAGNQLEMPSTNGITDQEIVVAIQTGELSEAILDQAVNQLLKLVFETSSVTEKPVTIDYQKHHEKAVDAAKRSMVLLKNQKEILPLRASEKIALIGDFANKPRYQGAGSSLINPTQVPNFVEVLKESPLSIQGYAQGYQRMGQRVKTKLVNEAIELAKKVDKVLLFVGLDESREAEGIDRHDLKLPFNQLHLIEEITKVNPNVVIVLAGGGVLELPFEERVQGILHSYLAGQGVAEALKEILLGTYNPSGKLSETYPLAYESVPSATYYPGKEATSEHREGLFVGYRYFDTANVPVKYSFGYGLSYTKFAYSDITREDLSVSFTVSNSGKVAGEEVAQLYIEKQESKIIRAKRELKGFEKIYLEPGQSKVVTIQLTEHDFSYYSLVNQDWAIEAGNYNIQIGSSIEDIRLTTMIEQVGKNESEEYQLKKYPTYAQANVQRIPDAEFYQLLGYQPPALLWDPKKPLGMNDTIAQARNKNWLGKSSYNIVIFVKNVLKIVKQPLWSNNVYFVLNMPFRQMERFTGGKISKKNVQRYLRWVNGKN